MCPLVGSPSNDGFLSGIVRDSHNQSTASQNTGTVQGMENAPQPVLYGRISATLTAAGPVITMPAQPGVSILIDGRQFERWALRQLRDSLFAAPEVKPAAEAA